MLWQFLTASSLGIYYYVSLICGCILLSWPLARLSRVGILVTWVVYTAYSVVALLHPALRTEDDFFWMLRDPLSLYALGFFLAGWAAQLWLPELKRLHRRIPRVVLGVVVAVAAAVSVSTAASRATSPATALMVAAVVVVYSPVVEEELVVLEHLHLML